MNPQGLLTKHPALAASALVALLALATLLVYWPGLSGPFVLDDVPNITAVYIDDIDLDGIVYSITNNESGWLGRSVAVLSFVLTGLQYGLEPWGYKLHNLLLHLCNGLLVFRLAWLLLPPLSPGLDPRRRLVIATAVSALWLLHPLQVSTVLYVVQRMTELAAFFSLLALLAYVEARNAVNTRRHLALAWLAFPLCLVLALLSKETGALVPVYMLVIELLVFRDARAWRQPRLAAFLLVFVVVPLLVGGLYTLTHFDSLTNYSTRNFTLNERLLTQLHVVALYARMILLPRLRDMGLYHDDFPITRALDAPTLALLALLVAACAVIWLCRRRAPIVAFGLAWFLASHLLESTFIPLELVFEHRNYLAAFGLLLPPVYYLVSVRASPLLPGVVAVYLALLMFQTSSRVLEWSDEALLLRVAVDEHPRSSRARTFYANYLYGRRRVDETFEQLRVTEEIDVDDAGASIHILGLQCREGRRDEAALARAGERLRQYPVSIYSLNGMENILAWQGEKACTELTTADIESLLADALAQPRNAAYPLIRGYLLRLRGIVNLTQRRYAQGVIDLRTAYELTRLPEIIGELVNYQAQFGNFADAEETLAYLRELDAQRRGVLKYLVDRHAAKLAVERAKAEAGVQDAEVGPAPVAPGLDASRAR